VHGGATWAQGHQVCHTCHHASVGITVEQERRCLWMGDSRRCLDRWIDWHDAIPTLCPLEQMVVA